MKVLRLCLVKEPEQVRLVSEQFVINENNKNKKGKEGGWKTKAEPSFRCKGKWVNVGEKEHCDQKHVRSHKDLILLALIFSRSASSAHPSLPHSSSLCCKIQSQYKIHTNMDCTCVLYLLHHLWCHSFGYQVLNSHESIISNTVVPNTQHILSTAYISCSKSLCKSSFGYVAVVKQQQLSVPYLC